MKVRTGFVSNSSSSSYVLIWRRIDEDQALSVSEPWGYLDCYGDYPSLFKLDDDMIAFINEHPGILKMRYYEVASRNYGMLTKDIVFPDGDGWRIDAKKLSDHEPQDLHDLLQSAARDWLRHQQTKWTRNISDEDLRFHGGSRMQLEDIRDEIADEFVSEEDFREWLENES